VAFSPSILGRQDIVPHHLVDFYFFATGGRNVKINHNAQAESGYTHTQVSAAVPQHVCIPGGTCSNIS
ncbi:MAG: hypothetical protein AAF891_11725, partial [Pseudomonadota bacterium]